MRRSAVVFLGALAALTFPLSAAAEPRLVLHTAGAAQGRVSAVVPLSHPADAATRVQHVDYRLRDGRRVIARGTSRFRAAPTGRRTVEHRLVLGPRASRAVRARQGRPLDLVARWREGDRAPLHTAVSLAASAEPALAGSYSGTDRPAGTEVFVWPRAQPDGTALLQLTVSAANDMIWEWDPDGSVSLAPPGVAQFGTWFVENADLPESDEPPVTATLQSTGGIHVSWAALDYLPGFDEVLSPG